MNKTLLKQIRPVLLKGVEVNLKKFGYLIPVLLLNKQGVFTIYDVSDCWTDQTGEDTTADLLLDWIRSGEVWEFMLVEEGWEASGTEAMDHYAACRSLNGFPGATAVVRTQYGSPTGDEAIQAVKIGERELGPWTEAGCDATSLHLAVRTRFCRLWERAKAGEN